jgi:hypothetical protein
MRVRRVGPITDAVRKALLVESKGQCNICGARSYLEFHHIRSIRLGGTNRRDNLIVLCPTCHSMVGRAVIPEEVLRQVKSAWVEENELGSQAILDYCRALEGPEASSIVAHLAQDVQITELKSWSDALHKYEQFDRIVEKIVGDIEKIPSEDQFITHVLKPMFEALGFEGVTVIHHTGKPERGKDIVFYDHDRLGSLNFYAVVATIKPIHANSSKTSDSGHYRKILDQISKCYDFPYKDHNLKGEFYIDKVIVATAIKITDEAQEALSIWERDNRKHLIYLSGPDIAGRLTKLEIRPNSAGT